MAATQQVCSGGEGRDSRTVSSGYRRPSRNQNSAVNGGRANRAFMRLSADDGPRSWEQRNVIPGSGLCRLCLSRHSRHSCAMIVLQATQDIRKVSLWLGHSNLTTTEVYVRADPTEKLEAIEAVVPPSLRKGKFRPPDSFWPLLKAKS